MHILAVFLLRRQKFKWNIWYILRPLIYILLCFPLESIKTITLSIKTTPFYIHLLLSSYSISISCLTELYGLSIASTGCKSQADDSPETLLLCPDLDVLKLMYVGFWEVTMLTFWTAPLCVGDPDVQSVTRNTQGAQHRVVLMAKICYSSKTRQHRQILRDKDTLGVWRNSQAAFLMVSSSHRRVTRSELFCKMFTRFRPREAQGFYLDLLT